MLHTQRNDTHNGRGPPFGDVQTLPDPLAVNSGLTGRQPFMNKSLALDLGHRWTRMNLCACGLELHEH